MYKLVYSIWVIYIEDLFILYILNMIFGISEILDI